MRQAISLWLANFVSITIIISLQVFYGVFIAQAQYNVATFHKQSKPEGQKYELDLLYAIFYGQTIQTKSRQNKTEVRVTTTPINGSSSSSGGGSNGKINWH